MIQNSFQSHNQLCSIDVTWLPIDSLRHWLVLSAAATCINIYPTSQVPPLYQFISQRYILETNPPICKAAGFWKLRTYSTTPLHPSGYITLPCFYQEYSVEAPVKSSVNYPCGMASWKNMTTRFYQFVKSPPVATMTKLGLRLNESSPGTQQISNHIWTDRSLSISKRHITIGPSRLNQQTQAPTLILVPHWLFFCQHCATFCLPLCFRLTHILYMC